MSSQNTLVGTRIRRREKTVLTAMAVFARGNFEQQRCVCAMKHQLSSARTHQIFHPNYWISSLCLRFSYFYYV
ncbi:hypothetical protein AVEN_53299-1 [Araneus ventricosus]|uniref:Uncharacterized protein n=1 Tax=Araneus ventricosus TaxID=182803 RepID=A0A4Y2AA47_ARAVE|nr:hypothetical protein AVEN_53299-1 [Araneus ventricosus]